MALIFRTAPRRQVPSVASGGVPRIDFSHPFAQGLIGCYLPGIQGGINYASPGSGDLATAESSATFSVKPEGLALASLVSPSGLFSGPAPSPFKTGTTFSIYWRSFIPSAGSAGTNETLAMVSTDATGSSPFWLYGLTVKSATYLQVQINWSNAGTFGADNRTIFALNTDSVHSICGTFNFGGSYNLYVDAANVGSGTTGAPFTGTATSAISVNSFANAGGNPNAHTHLVLFFNTELSASQIAALDADPYGFFIASEGEMPALLLPAGGGFTAKYRKTLSPLGTRVGTRQTQAA